MDPYEQRFQAIELNVARLEGTIATMDARIDGRLNVVDTQLKNIVQNMATKADLSELKASMIQWIVGTMLASAGLAFAIARFMQ